MKNSLWWKRFVGVVIVSLAFPCLLQKGKIFEVQEIPGPLYFWAFQTQVYQDYYIWYESNWYRYHSKEHIVTTNGKSRNGNHKNEMEHMSGKQFIPTTV